MLSAATSNLQLYEMVGAVTDSTLEYSLDPDAYTPKWYSKRLREFAGMVPAKVNEICDSDMSIQDKYEALDRLGILAIPYLIDRISQGEKQWQTSVYAQLLEYPTEERFAILSQADSKNFAQKSEFIRSSVPIDEIISENADFEYLKQFCKDSSEAQS